MLRHWYVFICVSRIVLYVNVKLKCNPNSIKKIWNPILKCNLAFFKQHQSTLLQSRNVAGFRESGEKSTHKDKRKALTLATFDFEGTLDYKYDPIFLDTTLWCVLLLGNILSAHSVLWGNEERTVKIVTSAGFKSFDLWRCASAYVRCSLLICDVTINANKVDIQNVKQHIWCYLKVFLRVSMLIPSR